MKCPEILSSSGICVATVIHINSKQKFRCYMTCSFPESNGLTMKSFLRQNRELTNKRRLEERKRKEKEGEEMEMKKEEKKDKKKKEEKERDEKEEEKKEWWSA
ncbi:hypothetical protein BTVI_95336 [Pitangus sulphuratus]|nr:hypothetical protein BTVI_95336 [Pitangus sulphuratus]